MVRLRTERGIAQRALATAAGVDASTISRVENGERGPGQDLVERIADALGSDAAERARLLRAAGFLPAAFDVLLAEPSLARLIGVFGLPDLDDGHRALLRAYVSLALDHAAALGYVAPEPFTDLWDGSDDA